MKDKLISLREAKAFLWSQLCQNNKLGSDAHYLAEVVCALLEDVPEAKRKGDEPREDYRL